MKIQNPEKFSGFFSDFWLLEIRRFLPLKRPHFGVFFDFLRNNRLFAELRKTTNRLETRINTGGASRNRTDVHGFAIRCITTLPLRQGRCAKPAIVQESVPLCRGGHRAAMRTASAAKQKGPVGPFAATRPGCLPEREILERETSLELATSTLARLRSTN